MTSPLPDADSNPPRFRQTVRFIAVLLATWASTGAALATALGWGARWHWTLDLLTHFPVQLMCVTAGGLAVLLGAGHWKRALLPAGVLLINSCYVAPLYWGHPATESSSERAGQNIRLVAANLHRTNRHPEEFIALIRATQPAAFFVSEMDDRWLRALRSLDASYPHSIVEPRENAFGMGLFSRHPFQSREIGYLVGDGVPTIIATLEIDSQTLTVIGVHPPPPIGASFSARRNAEFAALGNVVTKIPGPVIVLGDLNCTSWSPHFGDLLRAGKLRDTRPGFGHQPTWPSLRQLLQIPIDHALVSAGIEVLDRTIGPSINSDHLPVSVDIVILK